MIGRVGLSGLAATNGRTERRAGGRRIDKVQVFFTVLLVTSAEEYHLKIKINSTFLDRKISAEYSYLQVRPFYYSLSKYSVHVLAYRYMYIYYETLLVL